MNNPSLTVQAKVVGYRMSDDLDELYKGEVAVRVTLLLTPLDVDLAKILAATLSGYIHDKPLLEVTFKAVEGLIE